MRHPHFALVAQRIVRLHQDEAVALGQRDCRREDVSPYLAQKAPRPMAMASARPPASVRPGYFRSIRNPSLRSRVMASIADDLSTVAFAIQSHLRFVQALPIKPDFRSRCRCSGSSCPNTPAS